MSLFKVPGNVARKLEKTMRDFLWFGTTDRRRDHLVAWGSVCKHREEGCLVLGNLVSKNVALVVNGYREWNQSLFSTGSFKISTAFTTRGGMLYR